MVTTLRLVLRQRGLKISTKTLEGFVKEIDRIAPWFAFSGSFTIPSWEKLRGDLVGEQENGKLKAGTMPLWKLVRRGKNSGRNSRKPIRGRVGRERLGVKRETWYTN